MVGEGHPPGSKMLWWNATEGLDGTMGSEEGCKGSLMPRCRLWYTRTTAALPRHQETTLKPQSRNPSSQEFQ